MASNESSTIVQHDQYSIILPKTTLPPPLQRPISLQAVRLLGDIASFITKILLHLNVLLSHNENSVSRSIGLVALDISDEVILRRPVQLCNSNILQNH